MTTGSCLCGGVTFEISGDLAPIQICHCIQCRKAQGSAFVTNIPVGADQLRFTAGEDLIKTYASSPGKVRAFCGNCGSPLFSRRDSVPGTVRIRAGTLDGDLSVRPAFHIYWDFRANWLELDDGLPHYAGNKTD